MQRHFTNCYTFKISCVFADAIIDGLGKLFSMASGAQLIQLTDNVHSYFLDLHFFSLLFKFPGKIGVGKDAGLIELGKYFKHGFILSREE